MIRAIQYILVALGLGCAACSDTTGGAHGNADQANTAGSPEDGDNQNAFARPVAEAPDALGFSCPSERSEVDLPDDSSAYQIRILYVVPSDLADAPSLDTNGTICHSAKNFTRWLKGQTNGRSLRLDTHGGVLDIGFVRLQKTDAQMRRRGNTTAPETGANTYDADLVLARIETELRATNQIDAKKIYAVYYGGTQHGACGIAPVPPRVPGQVAVTFLNGSVHTHLCSVAVVGRQGGPPSSVDYTMLHEILHALGFVSEDAPSRNGFHVSDVGVSREERARDILYTARPGTDDPPWAASSSEDLVLDVGRDDYFEHGRDGILDLAKSAFLNPLPNDSHPPPGW